jgi:hypothetical protein
MDPSLEQNSNNALLLAASWLPDVVVEIGGIAAKLLGGKLGLENVYRL